MSELTICFKNNQPIIDPNFLAQIETIAKEYGFSIDPKINTVLIEPKLVHQCSASEFLHKADELVSRMTPQIVDSTDLIREDRELL